MKEIRGEKHKQRHIELHRALDELVADWATHTKSLPSKNTVLQLMHWANMEMVSPTEKPEV